MADEFKQRIIQQVDDVLLSASEKIVDTEHFVPLIKQFLTQVGT